MSETKTMNEAVTEEVRKVKELTETAETDEELIGMVAYANGMKLGAAIERAKQTT